MLAAARETDTQLRAMLNMLLPPEQQQQHQPLAPPPPPPPMHVPAQPPQQAQQPQLALQALAQQLAGALLQQQQQQHQHPPPPQQQHYPPPGATPAAAGGYQQMVSRLYMGQQCLEDGLRFPTPAALAAHAAWLEQVRALAAAGSGGSKAKGAKGKVLLYRAWASPAAAWCGEQRPYARAAAFAAQLAGGGEGEDGEEGEDGDVDLGRCPPVDEAHTSCALCGALSGRTGFVGVGVVVLVWVGVSFGGVSVTALTPLLPS